MKVAELQLEAPAVVGVGVAAELVGDIDEGTLGQRKFVGAGGPVPA